MAFIENVNLVIMLFDYLSKQNADEANDIMRLVRLEIDRNTPSPEDLGIKLWEPKEFLEDLNGSKEASEKDIR